MDTIAQIAIKTLLFIRLIIRFVYSTEYVSKAIEDFKNASKKYMEYLDNLDLSK